ncbi:hypothetical protein Vadar_021436 [Vaccinium darrowii]|uniref:Uncharacterized protein n=1 Tax=Vaccinium darrowii TaxID=229202 RepID=A0ACB7XBK3_9ERIC|nr:hypothetical protein Vadar_021436 [Vaccinium darrowii]
MATTMSTTIKDSRLTARFCRCRIAYEFNPPLLQVFLPGSLIQVYERSCPFIPCRENADTSKDGLPVEGQIVPLGSWPELKQYITECILSWCLDSILLHLFALLLNSLPKSYISTIPKHVQDALVDKFIDLVSVNPFDSDCVTYNIAKASFCVIVHFPSDNRLVRLFQVVADNVLDFIISEQDMGDALLEEMVTFACAPEWTMKEITNSLYTLMIQLIKHPSFLLHTKQIALTVLHIVAQVHKTCAQTISESLESFKTKLKPETQTHVLEAHLKIADSIVAEELTQKKPLQSHLPNMVNAVEISKACVKTMETLLKGLDDLKCLKNAFVDRYGPPSNAFTALPLIRCGFHL